MKTASIFFNFAGVAGLAAMLALSTPALAQGTGQDTGQTTAQGAGQSASKPKRVRTGMSGFDLSPRSGKSANQIGGASRDLGTPRLFAPNSGKAFSTQPVFYWGTMQPGEKVTFRLSTLNGTVVYETASTAGSLKYPADALALTPGTSYTWTILPENDMMGGAPEPVKFVIVGGPEREAIQSQLAGASGEAAAQVFVKHLIWYDAVAGYTGVLDQAPNDQAARAARAALYDQLPVTKELADADWSMVH